MMSPASSNPVLTDAAAKAGWPTIMRLYTRDDAQGAFIGPWIAKKYAGKNVVILHDKSAYGQGVADAVKATMNAGGLKEVLYEGINAGEKDYSALVTKLKDLKADVVYFGGYHPEAGLILRQSAEQNLKFQLIMPDSIASPEFWQVAGPAGEGTMFVFPSDPQAKPEAKEAIEKIKAGGFVPEGFTLFSYAVDPGFRRGHQARRQRRSGQGRRGAEERHADQHRGRRRHLRREGRPQERQLRHQPVARRQIRADPAVSR